MWSVVSQALPWVATALGGPLAGLAVKKIADTLGIPAQTVDEIKQVLLGLPPEKVIELKQVEADLQAQLAELGYNSIKELELLNVRAAEAVNVTMQVESKSEKWPQYSWRPAIGFAVAINVILSSSVVVLAYGLAVFKNDAALLKELPAILAALAGIIAVASPILGIASYFRGKEKIERFEK